MKLNKQMFIFVLLCSVVICILAFPAAAHAEPARTDSAKAAIVFDPRTGEILYAHDEHERLPMASTTKIMSALIALESGGLDEPFTVDSRAIRVEGSSMGLTEGDCVTMRALVCGQTTATEKNKKFVADYKAAYGAKRVTDDPIEAGYIGVYLWAKAAEKAGSFDVEKIKKAAKGMTFDAPEGTVTLDGDNQHIYKPVRIGKINGEGLIDEVWATSGAVKPDPYLSTYSWAKGL